MFKCSVRGAVALMTHSNPKARFLIQNLEIPVSCTGSSTAVAARVCLLELLAVSCVKCQKMSLTGCEKSGQDHMFEMRVIVATMLMMGWEWASGLPEPLT